MKMTAMWSCRLMARPSQSLLRKWGISMWVEHLVGEYLVRVKVFGVGSDYGIKGGRVSKLFIVAQRDGELRVLASYDRGWDVWPVDLDVAALVDLVVNAYTVPPQFDVVISAPPKK